MTDRKIMDEVMITALKKSKGIAEASPFSSEDSQKIIAIEQDAEKRSLLGLGKVVNTGVTETLDCDLVYVALTNMNFDWGYHPSLVLKKGRELVGEEIRDERVIGRLSDKKNVWFMHENFVVYKDKVLFPHDLIRNICHFEIPSIPAEWCAIEDERFQCRSVIFANPAAPCDLFLKKQYFSGLDERGLGTILVGVKL